MGVKVSVIVNVHNPGDTADACIRSMLEQTLPADEYEVIVVDDGSTDGIAERLDTIAAVRDHVRVLHLPYTGSPSRGRNVGAAAATGEYVYFLDPGDRLERDALAHMYERAVETDADVLIGRLIRDWGPPMTAFERSTARADILRDRLLTLLLPQQLYRRAFLEEHELGFSVPGGRLGEQAFVLRAYLQAKVIAVLAEHVCCHLGERPPAEEEPRAIVRELTALLDDIDAFVGEGRQRDRMYAYWLRYAVLRPLVTSKFADSSVDRGMHFRVVQDLMVRRFPERLDRHLPVQLRVVAAYARAGRLDQIVLMSNASRRAGLRADLTEVRWDAHVLVLGLSVEVMAGDGSPDRYRVDGDRLHWIPPRALDTRKLPEDVTDITDAVERARVELYVRHTETGIVHFLPLEQHVERVQDGRRRVRIRIKGETRLDITSAALGQPLRPGQWEVHVRMFSGANQARSRVSRPEGPLNCLGVLAQRPRMRLVVPCWSDNGELGLAIEPRSFSESIALVSPGVMVKQLDKHLYVVLPVPYVPPSGGPALELVLRGTGRRGREVSAPALVEAGVPGRIAGQLVAKVPVKRIMPGVEHLGPGGWLSSLRSSEGEFGLRFALEMRRGKVDVRPAAAVDPERRSPMGRDTALHRLGRRLPGARHLVRWARAGRHRYLTD
ncbi:glycosyltransferase involved in cell wall biosynthesis [Nonomuraea fuscirosea]|uniref:Glycosyltransferase involved in cell wall biosynthesis n=1 Tax=Nonomuraea fuscirosea TaxID=1291556 RepID=A0A2T0N0V4_9ACTN|nr:glycosyltransferase family 2 protein [Nonomuraea fuscirosea]PRX65444.1 glycosyltransferase involved in cell wall biosynthesis [Nonomuraea fuscirosea]